MPGTAADRWHSRALGLSFHPAEVLGCSHCYLTDFSVVIWVSVIRSKGEEVKSNTKVLRCVLGFSKVACDI